jgi:hypothetical protein
VSKFVCLFGKANPFVDEVEAECVRLIKGAHKPKGKNLTPENFSTGGPQWEMESTVFFNMARRKT